MELKKRKDESGEEYTWTDYMSLLFTQNVSQFLTPKRKILSFNVWSMVMLFYFHF